VVGVLGKSQKGPLYRFRSTSHCIHYDSWYIAVGHLSRRARCIVSCLLSPVSCLLSPVSCLLILSACAEVPDSGTPIVLDYPMLPTPATTLALALDTKPNVLVGQRQVIGSVTWEYVGQFGSEQVPPLPAYANPYEVQEEPPDAGFPARVLGSRMFSADGSVWRAVAIDEALAYTQANDYLGFERFSSNGEVTPLPPQVWDAFEVDLGEDPSTFVTGDEVYPPDPTDGMAYPESDHFDSIYCDYTSYWAGLGAGWWAPDGYGVLHPNDVMTKYLLTTRPYGNESETPYIGDTTFSTSENGPVVRISMGITKPNLSGASVSLPNYTVTNSDGVLLQGPGVCSGVLIGTDAVLTAAHCLHPRDGLGSAYLSFNPSFFSVCTEGGRDRSRGEQCVKVRNIFMPSTYTGNFTSDWMLLRLEKPIDLAGARPMALSLVDPVYLQTSGIDASLQGYPMVPHATTANGMCAVPNGVSAAATVGFWDWSSNRDPYANFIRNDYKYTSPSGYPPAGAFRWVGMPMNVVNKGSRRFKSTGPVKYVFDKSVMLDATHGGGYSGSPYYYNGRYVFGVHSIHYAAGWNVSTAGPRTSYWIVDMLTGLGGI